MVAMTDTRKQEIPVQLPGELELPHYRRLAELVRARVADGTYRPGERIPSENEFARSTGLSFLTVRQALKILVDEGILERFQGKGTYVTGLNWRKPVFGLYALDPALSSGEFVCEILHNSVERASAETAQRLAVAPESPLALMRHVFKLPGAPPFMAEEGRCLLDPLRPLIEAGLPASFLRGLIQGGSQGLLKSASLTVSPATLPDREAALLGRDLGSAGLKLDYIFYDGASRPVSTGSYFAPEGVLVMSAELGLPLGVRQGDLAGEGELSNETEGSPPPSGRPARASAPRKREDPEETDPDDPERDGQVQEEGEDAAPGSRREVRKDA
jgi:GntR family transcriptional regulator